MKRILVVFILVLFCLPVSVSAQDFNHIADLRMDGEIDILDLTIVANHFGQKDSHQDWNATVDIVKNNEIDIYDIVFITKSFGAICDDISEVFTPELLEKIKNPSGINLSILDKRCIEYPEGSGKYIARYNITFDSFLVSGDEDAPVPERDAGWIFTDDYNWNHKAYLYIPFKDENCSNIENVEGAIGKAFIFTFGGPVEFIPEDPEIAIASSITAAVRIPAMSMRGVPIADTDGKDYYSLIERGKEFLNTGILSTEMANYMPLAAMRGITAISQFLGNITGNYEKTKITEAIIGGGSKRGAIAYIAARLDDRIKGIYPRAFTGNIRRHVPCENNRYAYLCAGEWWVNRERFCSDTWIDNYDPYFHVNNSRLNQVSLLFRSATNDYIVPLTTGEEFYNSWSGEKYFYHITNTGHSGGHPPCNTTNYGILQPGASLDNAIAFTYKVLMNPDQEFPTIDNVSILLKADNRFYSKAEITTSDNEPEVAFYYSFFNITEDLDENGDVKSDFLSMIIEGETQEEINETCNNNPVECFRDFTTNEWFRMDMSYSSAQEGYMLDQILDMSGHMSGEEVLFYFVEVVADTDVGPVHITSIFDRLDLI